MMAPGGRCQGVGDAGAGAGLGQEKKGRRGGKKRGPGKGFGPERKGGPGGPEEMGQDQKGKWAEPERKGKPEVQKGEIQT